MQIKNSRNLPISNPKLDLHNINAHGKLRENLLIFTEVISVNTNTDVSRAENFVKNWRNLPISNPKLDLHNINVRTKFGENPFIFTQVITRKRKYGRMYDRRPDGRTATQTANVKK